MALVGLRSAATCGSCGKPIQADTSARAIFCRDCGCCLLTTNAGVAATPGTVGAPSLHPFVPPRVEESAAWERLKEAMPPHAAQRAQLTAARLLFVPFHEWAPDLSVTRIAKDARAVLAPAADLTPAGLRPPASPMGDDLRGLRLADHAHAARLADPSQALALVARGEIVDAMFPVPGRPPSGAARDATARILYYPFWSLTYRVDWKENRGVVDAATGRPVGPSSKPSRWAPSIVACGVGLTVFLALFAMLKPLQWPVVGALTAAAGAWGASTLALSRLLHRERSR